MSDHGPEIVALADASDRARFGGKAAGLATALQAGLPVPDGLALAPSAVARALAGGDLPAAIVDALPFPWAVRSSALDEDGARASFAGIHHSVLGVTSLAAAREALASVHASATSVGARAYRTRLGLAPDDSGARMAVVIQRLIASDAAGVLFTRNPATQADERVIEAAFGLGEAVVAGLVTPDVIRLSRDGRVLEQRVGFKDLALVVTPDGHRVEQVVAAARARSAVLSAAQIAALSDLARRCEAVVASRSDTLGGLDLEWAFAADRLFLLQRRSITR